MESSKIRKWRSTSPTVHGGMPERVCEDCGRFDDWSADGKKMLYHWGQPRRVGLLEVDSGTKRDLLVHPKYNLYQPHFSSDGGWVTFLAQMGPERRALYIAPLQDASDTERVNGAPSPAVSSRTTSLASRLTETFSTSLPIETDSSASGHNDWIQPKNPSGQLSPFITSTALGCRC